MCFFSKLHFFSCCMYIPVIFYENVWDWWVVHKIRFMYVSTRMVTSNVTPVIKHYGNVVLWYLVLPLFDRCIMEKYVQLMSISRSKAKTCMELLMTLTKLAWDTELRSDDSAHHRLEISHWVWTAMLLSGDGIGKTMTVLG